MIPTSDSLARQSEAILMSASNLNNRAIDLILSARRCNEGLTLLKQSMDIIMNQIELHRQKDIEKEQDPNGSRFQQTLEQTARATSAAYCRQMSELQSLNDFVLIEMITENLSVEGCSSQGSNKLPPQRSLYPSELVGVIVLYNTALVLWKKSRIVEAREIFKLALDLIDEEEDDLQHLHPSFVISVLFHLAETTLIMGDFEGAMLLLVEAIEIGCSQLPKSFLVATVCSRTSGLLMETGYIEAAEALYARTVSVYNSQDVATNEKTREGGHHAAAAA